MTVLVLASHTSKQYAMRAWACRLPKAGEATRLDAAADARAARYIDFDRCAAAPYHGLMTSARSRRFALMLPSY